MEFGIGAEVMGTDGKLGQVHRVIVDARTNHITDIVVKHGLFGADKVIPLERVSKVEDNAVHLDLDKEGFEQANGFIADHYHTPEPSYLGPPGFRSEEFLLDAMVAGGAPLGLREAEPPLGFPGGEQLSPDDFARPAVAAGTDVVDVNGEKVAQVHELAWNAPDGNPSRLVVRRGVLFHQDTEIPVDWIKGVDSEAVMLNVPKGQAEQLASRGSQSAGPG